MPTSSKTTEEILEARKTRLIAELMRSEPDRTRELLLTIDSLAALRSSEYSDRSREYARFKAPVDAVVALLIKTGTALTKLEIIEALTAGGFAENDPKRAIGIRAAIDYAVKGNKRLKMFEKKVGLAEWG